MPKATKLVSTLSEAKHELKRSWSTRQQAKERVRALEKVRDALWFKLKQFKLARASFLKTQKKQLGWN